MKSEYGLTGTLSRRGRVGRKLEERKLAVRVGSGVECAKLERQTEQTYPTSTTCL